jgi:hypothetical protein
MEGSINQYSISLEKVVMKILLAGEYLQHLVKMPAIRCPARGEDARSGTIETGRCL